MSLCAGYVCKSKRGGLRLQSVRDGEPLGRSQSAGRATAGCSSPPSSKATTPKGRDDPNKKGATASANHWALRTHDSPRPNLCAARACSPHPSSLTAAPHTHACCCCCCCCRRLQAPTTTSTLSPLAMPPLRLLCIVVQCARPAVSVVDREEHTAKLRAIEIGRAHPCQTACVEKRLEPSPAARSRRATCRILQQTGLDIPPLPYALFAAACAIQSTHQPHRHVTPFHRRRIVRVLTRRGRSAWELHGSRHTTAASIINNPIVS